MEGVFKGIDPHACVPFDSEILASITAILFVVSRRSLDENMQTAVIAAFVRKQELAQRNKHFD